MSSLNNKIDFTVVFSVTNANPNGDPLNGNMPRQDFEGHGEVSDVAIKRKLRNRQQDFWEEDGANKDDGNDIFVKMDERTDEYGSLKERQTGELPDYKNLKKDSRKFAKEACKRWVDVRAFGGVFADTGLSVGVRGPVSIQMAKSLDKVEIQDYQIVRSTSQQPTKGEDGKKQAAGKMGHKYTIDFGVYVFNGSISPQLAEKTGFSEEDAERLHKALETMFENDASAARPEGSLVVERVYWWKHNAKMPQTPSHKLFRSVKIDLEEGAKSIDQVTFHDDEILESDICDIYKD